MIFQVNDKYRLEPDYCSWALAQYYPITEKRKNEEWRKIKFFKSLINARDFLVNEIIMDMHTLTEAIEIIDDLDHRFNEKMASRIDSELWRKSKGEL